MLITCEEVIFVMVDIQEKFRSHITDIDTVVKNSSILNRAAEILHIPLYITEQYPTGLGHTLGDIYIPNRSEILEKTSFSIFEHHIDQQIRVNQRKFIVLYGIEAHICIMQSVLEALDKRYIPVVVEDAVSSISPSDKATAFRRIYKEGGYIVSTQMLLFEIIRTANHPAFKDISKLLKT